MAVRMDSIRREVKAADSDGCDDMGVFTGSSVFSWRVGMPADKEIHSVSEREVDDFI